MTKQILIQGTTTEEFYADLKSVITEVLQDFKSNPTDQDYLTREEVCELLNINLTTLWKHTKNNRLKKYKLGRKVFYRKDEVLDAIKNISLRKDVKLSLKEASKVLKIPIPKIKFHLSNGTINATKIDGVFSFNQDQLEVARNFLTNQNL